MPWVMKRPYKIKQVHYCNKIYNKYLVIRNSDGGPCSHVRIRGNVVNCTPSEVIFTQRKDIKGFVENIYRMTINDSYYL